MRRLIGQRARELMGRLEQIEQAQAAGEISSTPVELALLADEMGFLRRLMGAYVDEYEIAARERTRAAWAIRP